MMLSFIVDESLGLKEVALGLHLGFVVSLHAQNTFHEKNFHFFPTICQQKCAQNGKTSGKTIADLKKKKKLTLSWRGWHILEAIYCHVCGGVEAGR